MMRHGLVCVLAAALLAGAAACATAPALTDKDKILIADIANAKEVRLRIRGVNSVIERKMNEDSRSNFRRFMLKYFAPGSEEEDVPAQSNVREANVTPVSRPATVNAQKHLPGRTSYHESHSHSQNQYEDN